MALGLSSECIFTSKTENLMTKIQSNLLFARISGGAEWK